MKRLWIIAIMGLLLPMQAEAQHHHHHHPHDHDFDYDWDPSPSGYLWGFRPYLSYNGSLLLKAPPSGYRSSIGSIHMAEIGTNLHIIPWFFVGVGLGYEFYHRRLAENDRLTYLNLRRHSMFLSEQIGICITFSDSYLRFFWGPQQAMTVGSNFNEGPSERFFFHWGAQWSYGVGGFGIQFRNPTRATQYSDNSLYFNGLVVSLTLFIGF